MFKDDTSAEIIADSVWHGSRLTTFHATFPRIILDQVTRHRSFSFSTGSTRAIPLKKQIEILEKNPFVPQSWPKNGPGMVATDVVMDPEVTQDTWLSALSDAIHWAQKMHDQGLHKQVAGRILEPWMWVSVIISSTEAGLQNFFEQRIHGDAQSEHYILAKKMRDAYEASMPIARPQHVPWTTEITFPLQAEFERTAINSIARCGRTSYNRELDERSDEENLARVVSFVLAPHWSPLEHVAMGGEGKGNFDGWSQARHDWPWMLPSLAAAVEKEGPNEDQ